MSIDSSDLVGQFLDEQSRINNAVDDGDINSLVVDNPGLADNLGSSTDAITTSATTPPHKWDDGQSAWGFFSWA